MLYGLTKRQHGQLGHVIQAAGDQQIVSRAMTAQSQPYGCRVISMTARTYDSLAEEPLPVFTFLAEETERRVWNLKFFGQSVGGYIELIIFGLRFCVDTRRTHLEDVAKFIPGLRITAFPGLWEFDFEKIPKQFAGLVPIEANTLATTQHQSLCELLSINENDGFYGGMDVFREGWVSHDDPTVESHPKVHTVEVRDSLPFHIGQVSAGAMAHCLWNHDAGYTPVAWECRDFSHDGEWNEDTDSLYPADPIKTGS